MTLAFDSDGSWAVALLPLANDQRPLAPPTSGARLPWAWAPVRIQPNRCPASGEEGGRDGRDAHPGTAPYAPLACSLTLLEAGMLLVGSSVLSGTTTAVGPTDPLHWAMAAPTTGGGRWPARTWRRSLFLRSQPAGPATGGPCAPCREWRTF